MDKLVKDPKFLDHAKTMALTFRDEPVDKHRPDLFVASQWVRGVILALESRGYKIEKVDSGNPTKL